MIRHHDTIIHILNASVKYETQTAYRPIFHRCCWQGTFHVVICSSVGNSLHDTSWSHLFFSFLQFCFSYKIMSTALFKVSTSCFIAVFIWITSPVSPENTSSCDAWNNQWKDNFWRYSSQSVEFISHILLTLTSQIFSVSAGQPSLISDDADVVALVGTSMDLAKQINQKEVHWGVCYLAHQWSMCLFPIIYSIKTVNNADQTGKNPLK